MHSDRSSVEESDQRRLPKPACQVTPPERWIDSDAALQGAELTRARQRPSRPIMRASFAPPSRIGGISRTLERAGRNRQLASALDRSRFVLGGLHSHRMATNASPSHKVEADSVSAIGYPAFILGDLSADRDSADPDHAAADSALHRSAHAGARQLKRPISSQSRNNFRHHHRERKTGHGALRSTNSVFDPRTISMMRL